MHMKAVVLISITGIISMTASVVSGLFLYFEGLRTLEIAVEETCRSDMNGMVYVGNELFESVRRQAQVRSDFLQRYRGFHNYKDFQAWARESVLSQAVRFAYLNGEGLKGFYWNSTTNTGSLALSEDVWGSTRADNTREYSWGSRPLGAESYETIECSPCTIVHAVDPQTGFLIKNTYNYTQRAVITKTLLDNIGKVIFAQPRMWYASDAHPYFYMSGMAAFPPINNRLFNGIVFRGEATIVGDIWNKQIQKYNSKAIVIVLALNHGYESIVYGGNFPLSQMDTSCNKTHRNSYNDCFRRLKDLGPTVMQATMVVNATAVGSFIKRQITDSDHWIRRTVYFQPGPLDTCPVISLVWIKSVSSMSDELNKGLNLFIAFAVIVAVFDIIIGIVEIICVSMPLQKLSEQMVLATRMEFVDESIGVKLLSEIYQLDECFHGLVSKLLEYKSYLPQSMFAGEDIGPAVCSERSMSPIVDSSGSTPSGTRILRKCVVTKVTATRHPNTTIACLNLRNFRTHVEKSDPEQLAVTYGDYIQIIHAAAEMKRGTVDKLAGDRVQCTWIRVPKFATVSFADKVRNELCQIPWIEGITIGLSAGTATSGNLGSSAARSYMTMGNPVGEAEKYSTLGRNMPAISKTVILSCASIAMDARSNFSVLPVGRLEEKKFYVLLEECEMKNHEWMYELEEREHDISKIFCNMMLKGLDHTFNIDNLPKPYSDVTVWLIDRIKKGHTLRYSFHSDNEREINKCAAADRD